MQGKAKETWKTVNDSPKVHGLKKWIAEQSPNKFSSPSMSSSGSLATSPNDDELTLHVFEKLPSSMIIANTQTRRNEQLMEEVEELSELEIQQLTLKQMSFVNRDHTLVNDPIVIQTVVSFLDDEYVYRQIFHVCRQWRAFCIDALQNFTIHERALLSSNVNEQDELSSPTSLEKKSSIASIVFDSPRSPMAAVPPSDRTKKLLLRRFQMHVFRALENAHVMKAIKVEDCEHSPLLLQQLINDDFMYQLLVDENNCFRDLQLESVDLSACDGVSEYGFELLVANESIVKHLKQFCFANSSRTVSDVTLEKYICQLHHLKELTLDRCFYVSTYGMTQVSHYLRNIELLNISGCNNIKNFAWLKDLKHLKSLSIHHTASITDENVLTILSNVSNQLEELDLSGCKITGTLTLPYMLAYLTNLQVLNLSGTLTNNCDFESVEVDSLPAEVQTIFTSTFDYERDLWNAMYLLGHFKTLVSLDISHLSGDIFHRSWANLSNLRRLNVSLCGDMTNSDLEDIVPFLSQLEYVNLSWCEIEDSSLILLAQRCNINLKELVLKSCKLITPAAIQAVIKHCTELKSLNLMSTDAVTINELKQLSDMPHLTTLNVASCSSIDFDEVLQADAQNKSLGKQLHIQH